MYISCLVDSMVTGSKTPCGIALLVSVVKVMVVLLWSRWERKVHEMGDGRLALAIVEWSHGVGLCNIIVINQFCSS